MIANYADQTDDSVRAAGNLAVANGINRGNVYLGRNIFTTIANGPYLLPMANFGVGSGLFATGWCFQKFKPPPGKPNFDMMTYRSDADRYMWTGEHDLNDLKALKNAGVFGEAWNQDSNKENVIDTYINKGKQARECIAEYAKVFPAGSDSFFYTNYGKAVEYQGPEQYTAHLGNQSIWPFQRFADLKTSTVTTGAVFTRLLGARAPCAIGVEHNVGSVADSTLAHGSIILHHVNMPLSSSLNLILTIKYKRSTDSSGLKAIVWAGANSHTPKVELTGVVGQESIQTLALSGGTDPITRIGIYLEGPMSAFAAKAKIHVLDIFEILVKAEKDHYDPCKITGVELVQDGTTALPYSRLNWTISPLLQGMEQPTHHLPYSSVTGPFSHFNVSVGGTYVGRAHTLSFVLDKDAVGKLNVKAGTNVEIVIAGVTFDGTHLDSYKRTVTWH
jgi:hypothetical protein